MLRNLAVLSVICVAAVAASQAPPRVGVGVAQRKLGLREAIEMALKGNLEIEIERSNVSSSAQAIKAAQGAFDPIFRWMPGSIRATLPSPASCKAPAASSPRSCMAQNFSLAQKLPSTGAGLQAGFDNSRASTSNAFASLNPVMSSRLVFGYHATAVAQPRYRPRARRAEDPAQAVQPLRERFRS